MAINTYLPTIEYKKTTLRKHEEQRENHGYIECFDGYQMGGQCGGMDEEVKVLRSTNRELQNCHRDVKYSIENGVAKELICTTHGHEKKYGDGLRECRVLG